MQNVLILNNSPARSNFVLRAAGRNLRYENFAELNGYSTNGVMLDRFRAVFGVRGRRKVTSGENRYVGFRKMDGRIAIEVDGEMSHYTYGKEALTEFLVPDDIKGKLIFEKATHDFNIHQASGYFTVGVRRPLSGDGAGEVVIAHFPQNGEVLQVATLNGVELEFGSEHVSKLKQFAALDKLLAYKVDVNDGGSVVEKTTILSVQEYDDGSEKLLPVSISGVPESVHVYSGMEFKKINGVVYFIETITGAIRLTSIFHDLNVTSNCGECYELEAPDFVPTCTGVLPTAFLMAGMNDLTSDLEFYKISNPSLLTDPSQKPTIDKITLTGDIPQITDEAKWSIFSTGDHSFIITIKYPDLKTLAYFVNEGDTNVEYTIKSLALPEEIYEVHGTNHTQYEDVNDLVICGLNKVGTELVVLIPGIQGDDQEALIPNDKYPVVKFDGDEYPVPMDSLFINPMADEFNFVYISEENALVSLIIPPKDETGTAIKPALFMALNKCTGNLICRSANVHEPSEVRIYRVNPEGTGEIELEYGADVTYLGTNQSFGFKLSVGYDNQATGEFSTAGIIVADIVPETKLNLGRGTLTDVPDIETLASLLDSDLNVKVDTLIDYDLK